MGCSKKVSFQLFSELNWVIHSTQTFGHADGPAYDVQRTYNYK